MFCSQCGAPIKEGAKFCISCGAPVPTTDVAPDDILEATVVEEAEVVEAIEEPVVDEPDVSQDDDQGFAWSAIDDDASTFDTHARNEVPPAPSASASSSRAYGTGTAAHTPASEVDWGQRVSEALGALFKAPDYPATDKPLKYYKLLVWVALYLSGVSYALSAVSDLIHFSIFDLPFDLLLCCLALYARGRLAEFRADSLQALIVLWVGALIKSAIALIPLVFSVYALTTLISLVVSVGVSALICYLTKLYFDRRAELFCN